MQAQNFVMNFLCNFFFNISQNYFFFVFNFYLNQLHLIFAKAAFQKLMEETA